LVKTLSTQEHCKLAAGLIKEFKFDLKKKTQDNAKNYLHNKVLKLEWIDPQAFLHNFELLEKLKKQQASPNEKLTWLKWMTGEETDALFWKRVKEGTRKGTCTCGCGRLASIWLGQNNYFSCEHLPAASNKWQNKLDKDAIFEAQKYAILASKTKLSQLLDPMSGATIANNTADTQDTSGQNPHETQEENNEPGCRPCPFCKKGIATTQHWLMSCPVTLLFYTSCLEEQVLITDLTSKHYPANTLAKIIKATHTIHRVALARGAIGLETTPITTAASQKAAIKQLIEEHTHTDHLPPMTFALVREKLTCKESHPTSYQPS
jgi:hypothetical protein